MCICCQKIHKAEQMVVDFRQLECKGRQGQSPAREGKVGGRCADPLRRAAGPGRAVLPVLPVRPAI